MLSGINVYLHSRQAKHNNIEDLKAFVLLTAIKEGDKDTVATLLQRSRADVSTLGQEEYLPVIAQTLASRYMKGVFHERELGESDIFVDRPSILSWAIQQGHLALVARLLDEKLPMNMDEVGKAGHLSVCDFGAQTPILIISSVSKSCLLSSLVSDQ